MIGLSLEIVKLYDHEKEWETETQKTISILEKILGNVIKDIQHIGSKINLLPLLKRSDLQKKNLQKP